VLRGGTLGRDWIRRPQTSSMDESIINGFIAKGLSGGGGNFGRWV
jgi:hypothetical protein